jgi:hypothetical protein
MTRYTALLSVLPLAFSLGTQAATYYVDQTAGNDANDGASPTRPWKNAPGMSAYSGAGILHPGDTVYFDSGDTWPVAGTQGIYLVGGVSYIGDSWGQGTRAILRSSGNNDAGVVRFRDHATSPTIFKGFDVNANNTVSTGIDINHRYGQLMSGALKRVQNCIVRNTASRASQGQYKYGIIVSNHVGTGGYAENVEILDNVVHDISRDGINLYPGDENQDTRIKNITVRNNVIYNTGMDPDYSAGSGIVVKGYVQDAYIEYNSIHDVGKNTGGAGIFIDSNETNHFGRGPTNIHARYNLVNFAAHGGVRLYAPGGSDPKDVKIYGNILMNGNTGAGGISLSGNKGPLTLLVYNNTLYNSFVDFTHHTSSVNTLEFRNNIVHATTTIPLMANSGTIQQHSNNIYHRSSGTLVSVGGTNYGASNLSTFEPSASSANPGFKNTGSLPSAFAGTTALAPNNDGLNLLSTAYGVDHGGAFNFPYNGSINSVARPSGAAWDIGAYEFRGTASEPPLSAPTGLRIVQ